MASVTKGTDSISYTYDPNGIRTSKTVNGVTTKFHLMKVTLLGLTKGSDTMAFLYDDQAQLYGLTITEQSITISLQQRETLEVF